MLGQERGKEAVMAERQESSLGQVKVFRHAHGLWGESSEANWKVQDGLGGYCRV